MIKNVNIASCLVLIIYPLLLILLVVSYAINYSIGFTEILFVILGYYGSNIVVGIGLHRLWSHGSYKTNKYVEFILMMFSAATLQGPALSWVSNHVDHHSFTDTDRDPHTPLKFHNRFLGFLWAHIGWMLVGIGSYKLINRVTIKKLGKNKLLRFQLKYYWQIALFMNLFLPMIIGFVFGGSIFSAYTAFLFIGIGRAIQQELTFFVNSLCHFLGTQRYTKGTAGDIWWLFIVLLGENWHNFHHAFPNDYRNGAKWYQMDVHKWIIYCMSKVGLAWDLKVTPKQRIKLKEVQLLEQSKVTSTETIVNLKQQVNELVKKLQLAYGKLDSISNGSSLTLKILQSFDTLKYKLYKMKNDLKFMDYPSERIIDNLSRRLTSIEITMKELYQEIDKISNFA
ncbi:acyl-CoA desaturase [Rickettsia endosymbiont of Cardiosporidium cionae]|uniref:acyl-CoA desaturase n=1 Tax=Rickettsia endosymbiont of Cardiosporidium cionae TaxID=2777155 RepID=UPI0018958CA3|nr:fatty acid desaturase [Rickettsia endosymbiont of Cardiosporidium cionae]KAF8818483.1 acyl-CoA desaturase [Rickettsia endosymbiont of Cardiosporidium cionae]